MNRILQALLVFTISGFAQNVNAQDTATLVIRDAVVATLNDDEPSARNIAIRGNKIVEVTDGTLNTPVDTNTQVINANGAFVMPGFVEGHGHFMSLGEAKLNLELADTKTWAGVAERVATEAAKRKPGDWIVGRGWHQEKWSAVPTDNVQGYPVHTLISKAAPENPVLLTHASGHMAIANAAAMKLAGIDRNSNNPPGGELLFDLKGEPTGVLRETAAGLVSRRYKAFIDNQSAKQRRASELRAFELATQECIRNGVTSFHDAGSSFKVIDRLREFADAGKFQVRLFVMVREKNALLRTKLEEYRTIDAADGMLTIRGIKRMVDGALGAHGAWLLEAYADMPDSYGLNLDSLESLKETALLAAKFDYQLAIHAIGDRANREVLDIYDVIQRTNPKVRDMRWRVEHAQHLHPADIPRFAELNVIASMQAVHCTSDAPFVVTRLGNQRAKMGAYAWRSLTDSGAVIVNGSDVPVEHISPIAGIYATVTRQSGDGSQFFPEQKLSRMEALATFTKNAAYAAFREDRSGRIQPGFDADLVVLSNNLLTCEDDEILKTRVLRTIVAGRTVFDSENPSDREN